MFDPTKVRSWVVWPLFVWSLEVRSLEVWSSDVRSLVFRSLTVEPFLISPLGAYFDHLGWSWPQGWTLSHYGEFPLFTPPFIFSVESVCSCGWTKRWTFPLGDKVYLFGQTHRPILNFAPRGKLWPPGAKLSPSSECCHLGVKLPPGSEILCLPPPFF
jgi:hypothetical protein